MTYTWHHVDGRMAELCDECGFDARELTDGADGTARLDAAYAELERLLAHPDAERRPDADTWSAQEYVDHCVDVGGVIGEWIYETAGADVPLKPADLAGCREFIAAVPTLTDEQRAAVLPDTYPVPVTVEWLVRHLLHDTEHHVLDLRRNYAKMGMVDNPEVAFRG